MLRPSNEEFFEWTEEDSNLSKIQNALKDYPDLIDIKDNVRRDHLGISVFHIFLFVKRRVLNWSNAFVK